MSEHVTRYFYSTIIMLSYSCIVGTKWTIFSFLFNTFTRIEINSGPVICTKNIFPYIF